MMADELLPPALNLFQVPPTLCGIQNVQFIDFRPVSQLNGDTPIDFQISGAGAAYTDLSRTYLHIRARITKEGAPIADDEDVTPINLWMHSLFTQCDITLQQKMLYNSGRFYAYKSYIETLLKYRTDTDKSLTSEIFYKDSPDNIDAFKSRMSQTLILVFSRDMLELRMATGWT
jgi:hypothetical protein